MKKLITLLLLGHALSALATPDNEITLKLDNKLSSVATPNVSSPMLISPIGLKLTATPIDESRIGKISAEERTLLRERQKLLGTDYPMASFLAMKNQTPQLQNEPETIKLQLSLDVSPSTATSSAPVPTTIPSLVSVPSPIPLITANTQENLPKPSRFEELAAMQLNNLDIQNWLLPATGLVLVILVLQFGLRYYTEIKLRFEINPDCPLGNEPLAGAALNKVRQSTTRQVGCGVDAAANGIRQQSENLVAGHPAGSDEKAANELSRIKSQRRAAPPIVKSADDVAVAPRMALPSIAKPRPQPEALPSSQDTENFLTDFDPKRYGSVSEFLSSRNAITPEQLIGWSKYKPANRHFSLRFVGAPTLQI